MTGFGANQADLRSGVPVLVQQAVVDKVTGLTAAQAITAALFERERTGRGQVIEVPMLHAGLSFLWPDVSTNVTLQGDFDKLPPQSRTFRLSPTADGYVAMITVTTPQWNGLLRATGRDELVGHPDYDSPQQRGRNGGPLMKEIGAQLATLTTAEVTARLTEQGVPARRGHRPRRSARGDRADLPRLPRARGAPGGGRDAPPASGGVVRRAGDGAARPRSGRAHRRDQGRARSLTLGRADAQAPGDATGASATLAGGGRGRRCIRTRRRAPGQRPAFGALARVLRPQVFADGRDDARRLTADADAGEARAEALLPRAEGGEPRPVREHGRQPREQREDRATEHRAAHDRDTTDDEQQQEGEALEHLEVLHGGRALEDAEERTGEAGDGGRDHEHAELGDEQVDAERGARRRAVAQRGEATTERAPAQPHHEHPTTPSENAMKSTCRRPGRSGCRGT